MFMYFYPRTMEASSWESILKLQLTSLCTFLWGSPAGVRQREHLQRMGLPLASQKRRVCSLGMLPLESVVRSPWLGSASSFTGKPHWRGHNPACRHAALSAVYSITQEGPISSSWPSSAFCHLHQLDSVLLACRDHMHLSPCPWYRA